MGNGDAVTPFRFRFDDKRTGEDRRVQYPTRARAQEAVNTLYASGCINVELWRELTDFISEPGGLAE